MKKCMFLIPCVCMLAAGSGCAKEPEARESRVSLFAMNTMVTMSAYGETAETALEEARRKIEELEGEWSVTREDSALYRLNHNGGEPFVLEGSAAELLAFSLEAAEKTDGKLDPSIYPVLCAWGFTTGDKRVPEGKEIKGLLQSVGYENISMEGGVVTLPPGMQVDLGAVGKGYAADIAAGILEENGVASALMDFGGNIKTIGRKPDGTEWRLGLRDPFGDGQIGILELSDLAIATSGGYENYFIGEDGETYWHIIDPDTGMPARSGLASVSVIAGENKLCDALSTALFVMGLEEAEEYWRMHQDFEMILVADDGGVYITEGIAGRFTLLETYGGELHVVKNETM